uniref:Uncharacterized protein n=1 Tax=Alexandrium monilatum TaxID=311494 RepID=A0A7S4PUS0_9DINO|mmetsp:Transcript_34367/g.107443  ORF Transcript_34367/g.107443 Transcript_34367/m.107443 type:complete len:176 (+) Transcript_34367:93-620(+)
MDVELTAAEEVEKSGKVICVLGLGLVGITWVTAALWAVIGRHTHSGCNTNLQMAVYRLAVLDAILGLIVMGGVLSTKQMFGGLKEVALARSQEVAIEKDRPANARTFRSLVRIALCVQSVVAISWLICAAVAGTQAYGAKISACGAYPVASFWPLAVINFVSIVVNAFVYKCADA